MAEITVHLKNGKITGGSFEAYDKQSLEKYLLEYRNITINGIDYNLDDDILSYEIVETEED